MSNAQRLAVFASCGIILAAAGCQSGSPLYSPMRPQATVTELATIQWAVEGTPASTQPATSTAPAVQPPSTQPAASSFYTAPGNRIQQLALLAAIGAGSGAAGVHNAAREASEASLSSAAASSRNAAGLGASQPRTLTAVVAQNGLQRGLALGLGFMRPNNALTPQANRLTGDTGRCQELVRTGFFTNAAACQQFFRR